MGLFIDDPAPIKRPPVNAWAVVSLIVAVTGFVSVIGFFVGPLLAHVALFKLRRRNERGRRLAIAALCISYGTIVVAVGAFLALLVVAYAQLPAIPVG